MSERSVLRQWLPGAATLGLVLVLWFLPVPEGLTAPAFPSNTARGGVLYPIVYSLARGGGSHPDEATRKRMGAYLMFCGMASLTVSSALWLTAMAANPLGAETSRVHGLEIGFGSWLVAATFVAMVVAWVLAGTLKLESTAIAFAGLFATNYFSVFTPQGSSANLLFAGSGYLTQGELYRLGAITTVFSFLVYAVAGTPWVLLVAR